MRRKQVDMQQRLWPAKLICQMFRQESCHASTVKQSEERTRREETRSEPSWTPGGPSRSRLERQEVRPEAVLAAKRPVWRPSWPPGGPSGGRLERQEARPEAVLDARRPNRTPSWPSDGRNAGFITVLLQNAGFAQAAVGLSGVQTSQRARPNCKLFV